MSPTTLSPLAVEHVSWLPRHLQRSTDILASVDALARESQTFLDRVDDYGRQLNPQTATWGLRDYEQLYKLPTYDYWDANKPLHPYALAIQALNPDVWWRMGASSGSTLLLDRSGHGNDLTIEGNVSLSAVSGLAGDWNTGAEFSTPYGGRGYRVLAQGHALLSNRITMVAFVYPKLTGGAYKSTFYAANENVSGFAFGMSDDGSLFIKAGNGATQTVFTSAAGLIAMDTWQRIVVTYDGSNFLWYINGAVVWTQAYSGAVAYGAGTVGVPLPISVGARNTAGLDLNDLTVSEQYAGVIDELAICSRVVTSTEIAALETAAVKVVPAYVSDETRRQSILAKMLSNRAVSGAEWRAVLDKYVGSYVISFDHTSATINVTLAYDGTTDQADILERTMRSITPAHLNINFQYNAFLAGISAAGDTIY